jgi:DNA primase
VSLPAAFLDDLRARIGLAAVVGRRVKLTRAGREMKGCCPFHNEKTPSFYVNEDKGFYHCFGCGAHGDAIGFVMAQDGLSFIDAVKSLAAEAGLTLPEPERQDPEQQKRAGLMDLLAAAAEWYRAQLAAAVGADARAYLTRRGVAADQQAGFGLGFAPDSRDALSAALRARFPDVEPAQLVEAGLAGESDSGSRPGEAARRYDRFRGRLMFPIHDARGRVVGFGGRALGDVEPKYLNSPEGQVFHKGRLLYNLHRAAPAARRSGRLLVVEGYMDVVGLAGAGIAEAVAPLGTALTDEQMALAWKQVPEPVLAFDGDGAGLRAALRAATRALPLIGPGRSLAFVTLPAGQDPDDLARNGGKAAVEALLATARPLERFLFDAEAGSAPLDTPERRAAFKARLKALAAEIADFELRRDYLSTWLARADALVRPAPAGTARSPRRDARWQAPLPPVRQETRAAVGQRNEYAVGALLKRMGRHPELVAHHVEALLDLPIATPTLLLARDHLVDGRETATLLAPYVPLSLGSDTDPAFSGRCASALASIAESHHIAPQDRQTSEPASADTLEAAFRRNQAAALGYQEQVRRKAALGRDNDQA